MSDDKKTQLAASETTSFASSYIQWSETQEEGDGINYYGAGYFQHSSLINMKNAKTIQFKYTMPIAASAVAYDGVRYYPNVTFQVLNSSGAVLTSQTITPSSSITSQTTLSLNVSAYDMSSIRIRVNCSTTLTANNTLQFRLYSVYATY